MPGSHLIGKQIMKLEISSSKNAYAIQQAISDLVWNALVPEMNQLFDNMVGPEELIRLDKIELDLGNISLQEGNGGAIIDQLVQLLMEQCTRAIREINVLKQIRPEDLGNQNQQPLRNHYFKIWLHWLVHGTLPTYAAVPKENWLDGVMETLGLEDKAIEQLKTVLQEHPLALERLVHQHTITALKSFVELYTGFSQTDLLVFFKEINTLLKQEYEASKQHAIRTLEIDLWKTVFQLVILKRAKLDSSMISEILSQKPKIWTFRTKFIKKRKKYSKQFPLLSKAFQDSDDESKQIKTDYHSGMAVSFPTETDELLPEILLKESGKELATPQFFTNAGLVLLHPFLRNFFDKLNLLNEAEFNGFENQCKAVLLLHFLTGGKENIADFELVLPKFLCAMPSNLPLDHTLKLSTAQMEEGMNLLQAVIDHWGALGTTTPDGLREGFLVRDGKLTKDHSGWKLQVEQKTLDILLDRLPWNLSMIKLPWMKELLKVEWR